VRPNFVGMAQNFRSVVVFTPEKNTPAIAAEKPKNTPATAAEKPSSKQFVRRVMPDRTIQLTYPAKGKLLQTTTKKDSRGVWNITEFASNARGGVCFQCSLSGVQLTRGVKESNLRGHDRASFSCGTGMSKDQTLSLDRLMIPGLQRYQGIGPAMLMHILDLYRQAGAATITVPAPNDQGRRCYLKCGFIGRTTGDMSLAVQAPVTPLLIRPVSQIITPPAQASGPSLSPARWPRAAHAQVQVLSACNTSLAVQAPVIPLPLRPVSQPIAPPAQASGQSSPSASRPRAAHAQERSPSATTGHTMRSNVSPASRQHTARKNCLSTPPVLRKSPRRLVRAVLPPSPSCHTLPAKHHQAASAQDLRPSQLPVFRLKSPATQLLSPSRRPVFVHMQETPPHGLRHLPTPLPSANVVSAQDLLPSTSVFFKLKAPATQPPSPRTPLSPRETRNGFMQELSPQKFSPEAAALFSRQSLERRATAQTHLQSSQEPQLVTHMGALGLRRSPQNIRAVQRQSNIASLQDPPTTVTLTAETNVTNLPAVLEPLCDLQSPVLLRSPGRKSTGRTLDAETHVPHRPAFPQMPRPPSPVMSTVFSVVSTVSSRSKQGRSPSLFSKVLSSEIDVADHEDATIIRADAPALELRSAARVLGFAPTRIVIDSPSTPSRFSYQPATPSHRTSLHNLQGDSSRRRKRKS
jgi:hypothetical protein